MSASRRPMPAAPARRGWCPGLSRPMPTGDGLLARIHPPLGILTLGQARAVAEGSRRFGNGHIDLTARANLQVRGVREATRAPLARLLESVGLGDVRDDGGPQRLTLTGPLAGRDPAEVIDVPGLARAVEAAGRTVPGLPAKTLVAIEGRPGVARPDADFLVCARTPGRVGIAVAAQDGPIDLMACDARDAPAAIAALLDAFARSGRRRARDLSKEDRAALSDGLKAMHPVHMLPRRPRGPDDRLKFESPNVVFAASHPRPHPEVPRSGLEGGRQPALRSLEGSFEAAVARPHLRMRSRAGDPPVAETGREGDDVAPAALPPAGLTDLSPGLSIVAVDAPFGRCTADALDVLTDAAERLGAEAIRLSPARGFVLLVRDSGDMAETLANLAADFITAPDDPRRAISACTGAPACASGSTPTLDDAARIADTLRLFAARDLAIHVSGCAKGCARPGPADLTLVGREGWYDAVVAGGPGDRPAVRLPIEVALERLGRAATIGLAAAFAPDCAATGSGRGGRPG